MLHPYNEVVFSVGNLYRAADTYTRLLGWDQLWTGAGDPALLRAYGLPDDAESSEMLLGFNGLDHGKIRLVQFHNVPEPRYIRSGGQAWDTGGILDIDLRVSGIEAVYETLRQEGWHGYSDPVRQTMGPFTLNEVLVRGHDEVVLALVDRIDPPINVPDGLNVPGCISNVYLSAMIVRDLAVARHFFVDQLGFRLLNEVSFTPGFGANMFGLPASLAATTEVRLNIISPTDSRDAMLDLVAFEGVEGLDFAPYAVPPNRGILMYRFPVTGLRTYANELAGRGVEFVIQPQQVRIDPIGEVTLFAVRSPDGVWIEFWESIPTNEAFS